MAHAYTRRKLSSYFWLALTAGTCVVLFPLSLSQTDYRGSLGRGTSVAAYKASPAYAAFEDLHERYEDNGFQFPEKSERLAAGEKFDLRRLKQQPVQRQIAFKGMTIHAPLPRLEERPEMVAALRLPPRPLELATVTAQPHQLYADETPSAEPSITSLVEPPLREDQRSFLTASGSRVTISRGPEASPVADPGSARQVADNRDNVPRPPSKDENETIATLAINGDNQRPLWLDGQIEMTGGLAFVGAETQIAVKHMLNGQTYEKGRVWVTEGRFEIHVKRAFGFLVAELYTRDGRVLGRGEIDLMDLASAGRLSRVGDLRIALRPTSDVAAIRAVSGYSSGQQILPMREARLEIQDYNEPQRVHEDGTYSEPHLAKDSTFVARATAPKNWSSMFVGQAGRPQDVRLFSNSMVEALVNLTQSGTDRAEANHYGIVWGQVVRDGQTADAVEVEMAGDLKPIYFNDAYIPDLTMKATGRNGLFAFLRVRSGLQALRIKAQGRIFPAQVFPTEDRHISYVEFDLREKVVSQFKVFDIFDMNRPVSARIRMVGSDSQAQIQKEGFLEYSMAGSAAMVEADAGPEFEVSRTTVTGAPQLLHVPLLKRQWLEQTAQANGIALDPSRGMVAGFIDNQDFSVQMTGFAPHERMQTVYFDAEGKPTPSGVAGGGFVIFNAPGGLQTVYVHPVQSRESFSQVVVAEPAYVHVLAWSAQPN